MIQLLRNTGDFMLKEVKIELTNKCSRNCKHCSSNATSDSNKLRSLDYQDVARIIKEASQMGVETIVFTGGEPLMYDDLDKLIKLTNDLKMKSTIYTFAYRTDETLKKYQELLKNGLNKIIYSLADTLSEEEEQSTYDIESFFDQVFQNSDATLGFHYAVSKDSISKLESTINETISKFNAKKYFDKISLLRFVPHGKGTTQMNLSKEELLQLKNLYLNSNYQSRIRLGSPWNILGITHNPCIIADEIMIIGFDGIAYPCDSIKYFTKLGISGNIKDHSLSELYNSEYFTNIRQYNSNNNCSSCKQFSLCQSGCPGQKIIAYYQEEKDKVKTLKRCLQQKDPGCMK